MFGDLLDEYAPEQKHPDEWDNAGLKNQIFTRFGVDLTTEGIEPEKLNRSELGDAVFSKLRERYDAKERLLGADAMRYHERMIMLSVLDQLWKDHLLNMDHLKEGIGLRGYGQHDPLVEYKRESFDMFEAMMKRFREDTVRYLYLMQIVEQAAASRAPAAPVSGDGNGLGRSTTLDELEQEFQRKKRRELEQARLAGAGDLQPVQQVRRSGDKVGRNDPCPCGSGKKYKKCCGVAA
jgi:preprotein translocase subunit SecA